MILRVTHYGEAILRQKGEKILRFDAELESLAAEMIETMYAYEGIGLAAQQVGQPLLLCVVDILPLSKPDECTYPHDGKPTPLQLLMPLVLINPEVEPIPHPEAPYEEGCLSFPDIQGNVNRPESVRVTYQDLQGVSHTLSCDGLLARVIQHEVDHLHGILFIDHMDPKTLKALGPKLKKLQRQTREFLLEP